jgi:hypothetical protein
LPREHRHSQCTTVHRQSTASSDRLPSSVEGTRTTVRGQTRGKRSLDSPCGRNRQRGWYRCAEQEPSHHVGETTVRISWLNSKTGNRSRPSGATIRRAAGARGRGSGGSWRGPRLNALRLFDELLPHGRPGRRINHRRRRRSRGVRDAERTARRRAAWISGGGGSEQRQLCHGAAGECRS